MVYFFARIFIWAGLLLTLARVSAVAQAEQEAKITQATSISLGSGQVRLSAGTIVKVISIQGDKATISFNGPDGTPIIAQITSNVLDEGAAPKTATLPAALVPPIAPTQPLQLTAAKLRCEYRIDPLGIDSAAPRLDWILNATDPAARGLRQSAYQILVASSPDLLARNQGDLWNTGKVVSDQMSQIGYDGAPLGSNQSVWWKVMVWNQNDVPSKWSPVARWTMGVLTDADWQSAKWIGAPDAGEPFDHNGAKGPKSQYETILLRHEFTVKPGLKHAILNICGLGQYEATLNGSKVGDALLTPGWTAYDKTCLYDTYDITSSLAAGPNALGLFLGNGFYNVHAGRYTKIRTSYGPLQAIGLIRLEYANGSVEYVTTDTNWKVASGPITFSSIYGGEDFDARLLQKGWDKPGFDDSSWAVPVSTPGPGGVLRGLSAAAMPIRSQEVLTPMGSQKLSDNVTVYDLGQNAALMLDMKVKGPAGSVVKVTPSELVGANGDINDTMCDGDSYWSYTLDGSGDERYFSKFYYRGGRYLKVELKAAPGSSELPEVSTITAHVIRSDSPAVGRFSCSNEMYTKVFSLIRWAQMNNMMSVMTDCPTREKLGWLEEDHLNGPAIRYNFDVSVLMSKLVNDMFDAQRANGLVPTLVPNYGDWRDEGPYTTSIEWGSSCIMVPWQQYEFVGDLGLVRKYYDKMKLYIEYMDRRAHDNIIDFGLGDWYDNHSDGFPTLTPVGLTDTAFYYQDYVVLAQMAKFLGKDDDAAQFQATAEKIRLAFNQKFFDPSTNNYAHGAQGSNCLPLVMDMAEAADRPAILANLARDLRDKGTTSGEVSLGYLLRALAEGGKSDLIYSTYATDTQGYGLQVKLGKTSLTEGWNGGTSQDHFMFGELNEWFYHDLAGIQSDISGPGFRKIVIKPALVGDLTWLKTSYGSISGDIVSNWTHGPAGLTMNVTIPIGSTATVYVPAANADLVKENGLPAGRSLGVKFLRMDGGAAVYAVDSGSYSFSSADGAVNPTGLTAAPGSGQVTLSWSPSVNATAYSIKRSTGSGAPVTIANQLTTTTFTDQRVTNDTTYSYLVSAENALGASEGAEISTTPAFIINSGFEVPHVGDFDKAPIGGGWAFSPADGNSSAGITANHSGFTASNPPAPEGEQVALLQGTGTISQTLSGFNPDQNYTLTFFAAQRANGNQKGQTWQVKLDNEVIGDFSPAQTETNYTDYTVNFRPSATSQTLSFVGTNRNGGDNTIFIDQVRLKAK
jgi:alpha-L-rhamnosidase